MWSIYNQETAKKTNNVNTQSFFIFQLELNFKNKTVPGENDICGGGASLVNNWDGSGGSLWPLPVPCLIPPLECLVYYYYASRKEKKKICERRKKRKECVQSEYSNIVKTIFLIGSYDNNVLFLMVRHSPRCFLMFDYVSIKIYWLITSPDEFLRWIMKINEFMLWRTSQSEFRRWNENECCGFLKVKIQVALSKDASGA